MSNTPLGLSDSNFVDLVVREREKPVVVAFDVGDLDCSFTSLNEKGQVVVYRADLDNCYRFAAWLKTNGVSIEELPTLIIFADGRPLGLLAGRDATSSVRSVWTGVSRILVRHQRAGRKNIVTVNRALNNFDGHVHNFYTNVESRHMRAISSSQKTLP